MRGRDSISEAAYEKLLIIGPAAQGPAASFANSLTAVWGKQSQDRGGTRRPAARRARAQTRTSSSSLRSAAASPVRHETHEGKRANRRRLPCGMVARRLADSLIAPDPLKGRSVEGQRRGGRATSRGAEGSATGRPRSRCGRRGRVALSGARVVAQQGDAEEGAAGAEQAWRRRTDLATARGSARQACAQRRASVRESAERGTGAADRRRKAREREKRRECKMQLNSIRSRSQASLNLLRQ